MATQRTAAFLLSPNTSCCSCHADHKQQALANGAWAESRKMRVDVPVLPPNKDHPAADVKGVGKGCPAYLLGGLLLEVGRARDLQKTMIISLADALLIQFALLGSSLGTSKPLKQNSLHH